MQPDNSIAMIRGKTRRMSQIIARVGPGELVEVALTPGDYPACPGRGS